MRFKVIASTYFYSFFLVCLLPLGDLLAQDKSTPDKKIFKLSLSASYFFGKQSDYIYILQGNSKPLEMSADEKKNGIMLSTVGLVRPFIVKDDEEGKSFGNNFYFVLSLPILDFYNNNLSLFNKVSAAGFGLSYSLGNVYLIGQYNYGQIQRMTPYAYEHQQFPTTVYNTLVVNAEIPKDILAPYVHNESIWFWNVGLAFKF